MTLSRNHGFTLIELMVSITIMGILSTIVLGSLQQAKYKANDSKRIQEIRNIQTALELYYTDNGRYPSSDNANWETSGSGDGIFLTNLVGGNYMPNIQDPTTNNANGNYKYFRYDAVQAASYGCNAKPFYVLEIVAFQVSTPRNPGFVCPLRDWTPEGQYVVGKYE